MLPPRSVEYVKVPDKVVSSSMHDAGMISNLIDRSSNILVERLIEYEGSSLLPPYFLLPAD